VHNNDSLVRAKHKIAFRVFSPFMTQQAGAHAPGFGRLIQGHAQINRAEISHGQTWDRRNGKWKIGSWSIQQGRGECGRSGCGTRFAIIKAAEELKYCLIVEDSCAIRGIIQHLRLRALNNSILESENVPIPYWCNDSGSRQSGKLLGSKIMVAIDEKGTAPIRSGQVPTIELFGTLRLNSILAKHKISD